MTNKEWEKLEIKGITERESRIMEYGEKIKYIRKIPSYFTVSKEIERLESSLKIPINPAEMLDRQKDKKQIELLRQELKSIFGMIKESLKDLQFLRDSDIPEKFKEFLEVLNTSQEKKESSFLLLKSVRGLEYRKVF